MALATALSLAAASSASGGTSAGSTVRVRPGQSIQAAIDAAEPGSTVLVHAGRYRESLFIDHSITLRGQGEVLIERPETPPHNLCNDDPREAPGPGGERPVFGVCVVGEIGPPGPDGEFTVIEKLPDVTISKLHLRGFTVGVASVGTEGLRVERLEVDQSQDVAIIVNQAVGATIRRNDVHDNTNHGVQSIDNIDTTIVANRIVSTHDGNGIGLFVNGGNDVDVRRNEVGDGCIGILVLNAGSPATNIRVRNNNVHDNTRFCGAEEPTASGNGIVIAGASEVEVSRNRVVGNVATGDGAQLAFGGVAIIDTTSFGGGAPRSVEVTKNRITGNGPYDLFTDGTGTDLTLSDNRCLVTNAPGACTHHGRINRR